MLQFLFPIVPNSWFFFPFWSMIVLCFCCCCLFSWKKCNLSSAQHVHLLIPVCECWVIRPAVPLSLKTVLRLRHVHYMRKNTVFCQLAASAPLSTWKGLGEHGWCTQTGMVLLMSAWLKRGAPWVCLVHPSLGRIRTRNGSLLKISKLDPSGSSPSL